MPKLFPPKNATKTNRNSTGFFLICSTTLIAVLVFVFVVVLIRNATSQSVNERVCKELESATRMQASTLRTHLDDQFVPLYTVANMIAEGETFGSEEMYPAVSSIMLTHELCMFGFADMDGNVTNYKGKEMGDIKDRKYFYNIAEGRTTQQIEYLPFTKSANSPRMMFSVPVCNEKEEMIGVLFISMEIDVLERALFQNDEVFGMASSYFICDSDGTVIVASEDMYCNGLVEAANNPSGDNIMPWEDIKKTNGSCQKIKSGGKDYYVSVAPLWVNDWSVGCIVSSDNIAMQYQESNRIMLRLTLQAIGVLLTALMYIMFLLYRIMSQDRSQLRTIAQYNDNYKTLLREMNCSLADFDIQDGKIVLHGGIYDHMGLADALIATSDCKDFAEHHPEFEISELKKGIERVKTYKQPQSFETLFTDGDGKTHWIKIVLTPVLDDDRNARAMGAALDVSDMHEEFEIMTTTFTQIPGGIHRCYLSDPIHLEYYSEGMCKMLGYSRAEVDNILGPNMLYINLMHPDDRASFVTLCQELGKNGGKKTIEYRMRCKNGEYLTVSDTMDAKRSSSGIMYGYSVVADLHQYKQMQEMLEKELAETKEYLEQLKIKNFTSQMQPHFLYNALASIREIVLDDPEYASELICDFTTYLRACLRSITSDVLIPFSQEIDNIEAYVHIEKMRFGNKLCVKYDCPDKDFFIIPLSVQPLVENAIRHGIYERGDEGGTVVVRTQKQPDCIQVVVEDNGVGFDYEKVMREIHDGTRDSTGMFNLIYRFRKILNADVKVDSKPGVGTRVTVSIPIKEDNNESNIGG